MRHLTLTYVLFLFLCAGLVGCLAPVPGGRPPEPSASTSLQDNLLRGLDKLNEGLQTTARVSTQIATAQQQYEAAKAQALQQADLNHNGKVDKEESPLYYSLLAGSLSTLVSAGLAKVMDKNGDQTAAVAAAHGALTQEHVDSAHDELKLLAERLAALEAKPKA